MGFRVRSRLLTEIIVGGRSGDAVKRDKRPFEPNGWYDRVLYVLGAATGPYCSIHMFYLGEPLAGVIMAGWSTISVFYTIDLAIASCRRFLKRT